MASLIILKRRISSIRNTRQITKAMELVSASKLRRAQEQAQASRDYRQAAYGLLARLNTVHEVTQHPLYKHREVKRRLYVVITSNSGLAGAYNANALKLLSHSLTTDSSSGVTSSVITIGNKGVQFIRRIEGVELLAHYPAFGDNPTAKDIRPVLETILEQYADAHVDEVNLIYTDFVSSISQVATSLPLLPAKLGEDGVEQSKAHEAVMNFEPDAETVIHQVTKRLIEVQIWQSLLESMASEHAMRMLAMKSATDNANDLIGDYTLEYNTARQSAITQEIAEITGGAEAMAER